MSASETPFPDSPNPAPVIPGDDLVRATLKRQMQMLGDLADAGLVIARAVGERMIEAQGERAPVRDICDLAGAFDRVNRALRYTIMLEGRLLNAWLALDRGEARPQAKAAGPVRDEFEAPGADRKAQVAGVLKGVIAGETDGKDTERRERLEREAAERLRDDRRLGDILTLPISDVIDIICRDLGIQPDWLRLSEEDWARGELRSGKVGAALAAAALSGRPPPGEAMAEAGPPRPPLLRPSRSPPVRAGKRSRRRRAAG